MLKILLLSTFLSCVTSSSSSKRILGDQTNASSSSNNSNQIKRLKVDKTSIEGLEHAIKFDDKNSFIAILEAVGCQVMEPEQSELLNGLVKTKNEEFLCLLFSRACTQSFDLFLKAIDLAYEANDKMAIKALLISIYGPLVELSAVLINIFLGRNDFDAILMILDIGYSLNHYKDKYNKTIAHIAAENDCFDIVKKIQGCNLFFKRDKFGQNPIFYAQDIRIIKEIRRKCPLTRDLKNFENLTTWQESLLSKDFSRLNALISFKKRIKKLNGTFLNFHKIGWLSTASILRVKRENILEDSYKEVQMISSKWYKPKHGFFIKYLGEIGMDNGGLKVDWINNLFKKIFSEDSNDSVFIKIDDETGCFAPNINYHLTMFKFVGSIVALSIGLAVPMKVKFIPAIYRKIFREPLNFERDLMEQSPSVFNNLLGLKDKNINLSDLDLSFPNNPYKRVTKRNLTKYIKEYSFYSIYGAYKAQIEAFVEGFSSVLSEEISKFITIDELIKILKGNSKTFTAEDFIDNCNFPSLEVKNDIKEIIAQLTPKQKGLLLKFITGSEILPFEGFSGLKPEGIKVCVLNDLLDKLPTSSTCSNLLKLPPYQTVEELKLKLIYAIEMTETIDFEPGVTEHDEIVLGLDDSTADATNTSMESESEVSEDEQEEYLNFSAEINPQISYFRQFLRIFGF